VRSYKNQFESKIVERMDAIIRHLESMRYPTGPARYYGIDLTMCLRGGALAGSLVVAAALMELYIRALVVRYTIEAQRGWHKQVDVELEIENMRKEDFYNLLSHLVDAELFSETDANCAKEIYRKVRIPTHHGLPARLLGISKDDPFRVLLGRGRAMSTQEFESYIEDEALPIIEAIVGILFRNQVREFA